MPLEASRGVDASLFIYCLENNKQGYDKFIAFKLHKNFHVNLVLEKIETVAKSKVKE